MNESSRLGERLGKPSRAAYRRDSIKLRNRSILNKAVGRVPAAFVFLIVSKGLFPGAPFLTIVYIVICSFLI